MSEDTGFDQPDQPDQPNPELPEQPEQPSDVAERLDGTGRLTGTERADAETDVPAEGFNPATYEEMLRLAATLDRAGEEMRQRAKLGADIVADDNFADSAPLSPRTHREAEESVRAATSGKQGLLSRSVELDADAMVVRATVLTYQWIDELRSVALRTLGSVAEQAIGYLSPDVALGGAIVSAGLIETDTLDRDGLAEYLSELAQANPELLEHVTSGGGGLLDSLPMRSSLTAGPLHGDPGKAAARSGLRATGAADFTTSFAAAWRDSAGDLIAQPHEASAEVTAGASDLPRGLAGLMSALVGTASDVVVHQVAPSRYIAYLPGPGGAQGQQLRLVGGDPTRYTTKVVRTLTSATEGDAEARVLLVGCALGGVVATEVAAEPCEEFVVDHVVTADAPAAHVPRIPGPTRVLSLEDRSDPVALLGSLFNAEVANRITVVFDGSRAQAGESPLVAGGRDADAATHPELVAEIARIRNAGYLAE